MQATPTLVAAEAAVKKAFAEFAEELRREVAESVSKTARATSLLLIDRISCQPTASSPNFVERPIPY